MNAAVHSPPRFAAVPSPDDVAGQARLLVLDDSQARTASLMEILARVDVAYIVAAGHASARAIRSVTDHPLVIVLDMRKRRESAAPLLGELRRQAAAPLMVLLTNCPEADDSHRCLDAGADYFFAGESQFGEFSRVLLGEVAEAQARRSEAGGAVQRGTWTSLLVMD